MLFLSSPPTQDRLNAAVYECVCLRMSGPITIPIPACDIYNLIEYLETRFKTLAATYRGDSSEFSIATKFVTVREKYIVIKPMKTETSFPSSHPEGCANHTPYFPTEHS